MGRQAYCYTWAIELEPANATLYSNRANARAKLGELDLALEDARKAVRHKPVWAKASNPVVAAS